MIDRTTVRSLEVLRKTPVHLPPDGAIDDEYAPLVAAGLAMAMPCNGPDGVPTARLCVTADGLAALEHHRHRIVDSFVRLAPIITAIAALVTACTASCSVLNAIEELRNNPNDAAHSNSQNAKNNQINP